MRFADIRETIVKRTDQTQFEFDYSTSESGWPATPRKISPFEPGTTKVKAELLKSIGDDVQWPTYNRASRRANGQVKGRKRIRGTLPPHPMAVLNAARRIERAQVKMLQKLDAAVQLDYGDDSA